MNSTILKNINILHVEDNLIFAMLINKILSSTNNQFNLNHAENLDDARKLLINSKIDVVLLDLSLQDSTGFKTFQKLKSVVKDAAIIVLTSSDDEALATNIVRNGAQDYLLKDAITENMLLHSIKFSIERKRLENRNIQAIVEKEILLKEVHHRVKNNLQIISSLINLQQASTKDPNMRDVIQEINNRIKSIAIIHEKLYNSKDLERINFNNYINELVGYLFRAFYNKAGIINSKVNVENIFLNVNIAVPCGLIINEIITNSLKYAFPENNPGEIHIEFFQDANNNYVLIIGDNGVGLPVETDDLNNNSTSFGFQLIKILVKQLDATINLEKNNGLKYTITFPAVIK